MLENLSQTWKIENFEKMVNFCNCYFDFKFCKNIFFLFNISYFGSVLYGPLSNTQCVLCGTRCFILLAWLCSCVYEFWKIWILRIILTELWYIWIKAFPIAWKQNMDKPQASILALVECIAPSHDPLEMNLSTIFIYAKWT